MKTVFLIVYLWHASGAGDYSGGSGGPALTIAQMPSLAACEVVGRVAKETVDQNGPEYPNAGAIGRYEPPFRFTVKPSAYRCVEVAK